jgi:hypothetical protein
MNNTKVEEIKADNSNGRTINLSDVIWYSWGYNGKVASISRIGADLAKNGFDVKLTHRPSNEIGIFQVFVEVSGQNVLVYSKNKKDSAEGVIISDHAKNSHDEIVQNILARFN